MCEGVDEDSRHRAWHVDIRVGMCIILLEFVCVFHCMSNKVGSSLSRKIQLLGIAHPIVGNNFRY